MKSQIETAKKQIRELKETMPYLFVQYQEYKNALDAYNDAKIRYENAKDIWDNFGK